MFFDQELLYTVLLQQKKLSLSVVVILITKHFKKALFFAQFHECRVHISLFLKNFQKIKNKLAKQKFGNKKTKIHFAMPTPLFALLST